MSRESNRFFQGLKKNKLAFVGLLIILFFAVLALLGYAAMPDKTPLANERIPELRKLTPGSTVQLLKVTQNRIFKEKSFFERFTQGTPSPFIIKSITNYHLSEDSLFVLATPLGFSFKIDSFPIADILFALQSKHSYRIDKGNVFVKTIDQTEEGQFSKVTLIARLESNFLINKTYWLGTDKSGRDMLSMLIYGARVSLMVGILAVLISLVVGMFFGALAGYLGGWVDSAVMWVLSVIWSVPGILLVIAISLAIQSKGVWVTFLAVGLTMWVEVARVVRGQVFEVREKQYVLAAKALGFGDIRILFRHILPQIVGPIIVIATANFASAILVEAGLSFLGLGAQPPTPSWGQMVRQGYQLLGTSNSWHILALPCICISLLVLSFNLFGNFLRDYFSPN
ncbi:MAG: ABC transporter permease [Cyclobacteriaceae bacterium]